MFLFGQTRSTQQGISQVGVGVRPRDNSQVPYSSLVLAKGDMARWAVHMEDVLLENLEALA